MLLLASLAAEEHELAYMPMDPIWFAVIAGAIFIFLGFVTWSFRDVANRHRYDGVAPSHDAHGTEHH